MSDEESPKSDVIGVVGFAVGGARVVAEGTHRANLSIHHLLAAAHFSRHVSEIEHSHAGEPFGEFFEEVLWFSSACVLSSVAGLEAYANELFVDRSQHFTDLRAEIIDKLWELFEQKPTLEKFDMALLLKKKPLLNRGCRPTQDVAALVALRNGLIHFKPEWDDEKAVHARISQQLTHRFKPSPFLPDPEWIFPRRWATHGCTAWAVESSVAFLSEFESISGVPSKLAKFIERLKG